MRTFTVHLPDPTRRDAATLEKAEFVADGFCYGAFVFGEFWLLYRRLWVALALYLVALAVVAGLGMLLKLDGGTMLALSALMHLFLGLEGNQIRRLALEKSGRPAIEVVAARSVEEAEAKFFAEATRLRPMPASAPAAPALATPAYRSPSVLGVFPEPGGRA